MEQSDFYALITHIAFLQVLATTRPNWLFAALVAYAALQLLWSWLEGRTSKP